MPADGEVALSPSSPVEVASGEEEVVDGWLRRQLVSLLAEGMKPPERPTAPVLSLRESKTYVCVSKLGVQSKELPVMLMYTRTMSMPVTGFGLAMRAYGATPPLQLMVAGMHCEMLVGNCIVIPCDCALTAAKTRIESTECSSFLRAIALAFHVDTMMAPHWSYEIFVDDIYKLYALVFCQDSDSSTTVRWIACHRCIETHRRDSSLGVCNEMAPEIVHERTSREMGRLIEFERRHSVASTACE